MIRHLPTAARVLLGLIFFVFGLNGFLHFIPQPPPETLPAGALAFGGAMVNTGYMIQLLKGTEVVAGLLLLTNRYTTLALAVLAPIVINIVLFHVFLEPSGTELGFLVLALGIFLAWSYRDAYRTMLAARVRPRVPAREAGARERTPALQG